MVLHNKKSPKTAFPGRISHFFTSTTPLNIGIVMGIDECFRQNRKFLLSKVNSHTISMPTQYIPTVHKFKRISALFFAKEKYPQCFYFVLGGSKVDCVECAPRNSTKSINVNHPNAYR